MIGQNKLPTPFLTKNPCSKEILNLAESCPRDSKVIEIDKISAAQQQIETAILNLFLENWISAITLSGAAEEMLPESDNDPALFTVGKSIIAPALGIAEPEFVEFINGQKNWLKHIQTNKPVAMKFDQQDATIMILRALTKFYKLTNEKSEVMQIFEAWMNRNFEENISAGTAWILETTKS